MTTRDKTASQNLFGLAEDSRQLREDVAAAMAEMQIAQQIYAMRTSASLTQSELAKRIGTTQSVIARLEDAEYTGHSMGMLQRIAEALDQRVEIRFVPVNGKLKARPRVVSAKRAKSSKRAKTSSRAKSVKKRPAAKRASRRA
jgi:transcriptional regulator with XRE-family HTH domain